MERFSSNTVAVHELESRQAENQAEPSEAQDLFCQFEDQERLIFELGTATQCPFVQIAKHITIAQVSLENETARTNDFQPALLHGRDAVGH